MKKEAVALCRVSSAEQRVEGSSLESQQKHVHDFARNTLGCEIDPNGLWSLDVSSKAGKNIHRKDLEEIREYCKKHREIKYFIVDKVNRLMREIKTFYWFIQELEMIGVKTFFADTTQQDLNRDDSIAQLKTFLAIYEAERDNKERQNTTLTRMKDRVLLGYWPFPIHAGYKKSNIPGLHEPNGSNFSLLQGSMRDIVSGRFTVSEALADLTRQGYRTTSGKELRIDKFREILLSDYYAGLITVKTWSKNDERFTGIKGLHTRMITLEEHEILVDIVNGKKRVFERKKDNKTFPFGNIGICECGGKLVGFYHRNGHGSSWRSPKYRCRKCKKQYHANPIHLSFDENTKSIMFDRNQEEDFVKALEKVWAEEERFTLEKVRALERQLDNLKLERNQVVKKIALNSDSSLEEDFKIILNDIKGQIDSFENEIRECNKIEEDRIDFIRFSLKFLDERMDLWKQLDRAERQKCKQLAFPGGIIVNYSEKVCTPEISPILKLIPTKKEPETRPDSLVVDSQEKIWNSFIDIILEWEPILRQIDQLENEEKDGITLSQ